ncbi:hypothetical protein QBC35DRAFT_158548 [Podospora australis]|uniref:Secreted protein n=1 Tax=Podospora australis TaxID=1536484 RepID=A0AAN6X2H9_9PEZI|nr:hypothetical protein QBC35DRAFT_158548 [Podospora australis]
MPIGWLVILFPLSLTNTGLSAAGIRQGRRRSLLERNKPLNEVLLSFYRLSLHIASAAEDPMAADMFAHLLPPTRLDNTLWGGLFPPVFCVWES